MRGPHDGVIEANRKHESGMFWAWSSGYCLPVHANWWITSNYDILSLCFSFQVKNPIVNAKSRVLVPGLPGHQAPVKGTPQWSEKRKKDTDTKEVGSFSFLFLSFSHPNLMSKQCLHCGAGINHTTLTLISL